MKHFRSDTPPALQFLADELERLDRASLLRLRPEPLGGAVALSFCSNDYLGFAAEPRTVRAHPGAGASRLVVGENTSHRTLEATVAGWLGTPAVLTFTSGYASNLGVVSALARSGDLLISDALNHASLIDGVRLSRAEVVVVPHNDTAAVARALEGAGGRRAWVVTESYFSMDADTPNLPELRRLCDLAGAGLVVDEAHALGLLGPDGRGLCAEHGVAPDVLLGTFGKSFGAGGAFAAGCEALVAWLWNRARSFVFSTGLSPLVAEAARLGVVRAAAEPEHRRAALARSEELRAGLRELGLTPLGFGPIVPLVIGSAARAVGLAERLRAQGFMVQPIRPPTVPEGAARLRLTTTAAHRREDVVHLLNAIRQELGT